MPSDEWCYSFSSSDIHVTPSWPWQIGRSPEDIEKRWVSNPLCSVQPCSYTEPGASRELVNEFLSYKWLWNEALFLLKGGAKGIIFVDSAVLWDVYGLDLTGIICSPNIPMVLWHQAGPARNLVCMLGPPGLPARDRLNCSTMEHQHKAA